MNERLAAGFHRLLAPVWARREAKRQASWEELNRQFSEGISPEVLKAAESRLNAIYSRDALITVTEIPPEDFAFTTGGDGRITEAWVSEPSLQKIARTSGTPE